MEGKCKICGVDISDKKKDAVYCSKCSKEYWNNRRKIRRRELRLNPVYKEKERQAERVYRKTPEVRKKRAESGLKRKAIESAEARERRLNYFKKRYRNKGEEERMAYNERLRELRMQRKIDKEVSVAMQILSFGMTEKED